jgi:hypothetical protein
MVSNGSFSRLIMNTQSPLKVVAKATDLDTVMPSTPFPVATVFSGGVPISLLSAADPDPASGSTVSDGSGIAQTFASKTDFNERFAIPKKSYHLYLLRRVYLALDKAHLTPAILYGICKLEKGKPQFITSAGEPFSLLYFDIPSAKKGEDTGQKAISMLNGKTPIAARAKTLLYKPIPAEILSRYGIKVYTHGYLSGLPLKPITATDYEEIASKHEDLIELYAEWQTANPTPLAKEGHANAESVYLHNDLFKAYVASKKDKDDIHAGMYEKLVGMDTSGGSDVSSGSGVSAIKTYNETPTMDTISASFAADKVIKGDGTAHMAVLSGKAQFGADGVPKLLSVANAIENMGWSPLCEAEKGITYSNPATGMYLNFFQASSPDASILASLCLAFGEDSKPLVSFINVERVPATQRKELMALMAKFDKINMENDSDKFTKDILSKRPGYVAPVSAEPVSAEPVSPTLEAEPVIPAESVESIEPESDSVPTGQPGGIRRPAPVARGVAVPIVESIEPESDSVPSGQPGGIRRPGPTSGVVANPLASSDAIAAIPDDVLEELLQQQHGDGEGPYDD